MPTIEYRHQFPYLYGEDRGQFPGLLIDLCRPGELEEYVTIQAHLDTGAEYSLFDGELATGIGLRLMEGEDFAFSFTSGEPLIAKRHRVAVGHSELGRFELVVAFSTSRIRRNILGRDFLGLVQVGFRECQGELYLTPTP